MADQLNGEACRLRDELALQEDEHGRERLLDFVTMLAAADEAIGALRRGDADAVDLHVGTVRENLRTAELPHVRIVES